MIKKKTASQVPLSLQPPRPARQRRRGRRESSSRRTHSETKCIQIQTSTYICPASVQQQWRSAAAVGAPPVPLPLGQLSDERQRDSQRIYGARAQGGIQQVSSYLAAPGADHLSGGWRAAAGLLQGCSILVEACAAAAGGSGDPQLSPPPTVGP